MTLNILIGLKKNLFSNINMEQMLSIF